jgi:hypothetical protein
MKWWNKAKELVFGTPSSEAAPEKSYPKQDSYQSTWARHRAKDCLPNCYYCLDNAQAGKRTRNVISTQFRKGYKDNRPHVAPPKSEE